MWLRIHGEKTGPPELRSRTCATVEYAVVTIISALLIWATFHFIGPTEG
jgi:hypothetical protein